MDGFEETLTYSCHVSVISLFGERKCRSCPLSFLTLLRTLNQAHLNDLDINGEPTTEIVHTFVKLLPLSFFLSPGSSSCPLSVSPLTSLSVFFLLCLVPFSLSLSFSIDMFNEHLQVHFLQLSLQASIRFTISSPHKLFPSGSFPCIADQA